MPITPAHAAVAPLIQRLTRPLSFTVPLSAVVVGTMMPDFEYLIRLSPGGGTWHTPSGLFEFCLPVGLAVWLVFRLIIGPALMRLLPPGLGREAATHVARGPTYRLIPAAAFGLLLGTASHDLWDSFTHEARWGVRQIPVLDATVPYTGNQPVQWFSLLQYASSVLGIIVVLALAWRWVARRPLADRYIPVGQRRWRVRELGVLLLAGGAGAVANASRTHLPGVAITLGLAAVGAMSAFAVALVVYGVLDAIRHRMP